MSSMSESIDGDGSLNDVPWASVFDPAANVRALSAIQAEGFRAASQLVDRFVRIARADGDTPPSTPAAPALPDLEQLSRAWWTIAGQFLLSGGRSREVELDLASPGGAQGVVLDSAVSGRAETVVWLHNRTGRDFGRVRLLCSDLMARDGSVIGSAAVRLEPQEVPMPPRCSRGIAVEIGIGATAAPGVYRGTLLVDADDSLWLPVALTVRAQS